MGTTCAMAQSDAAAPARPVARFDIFEYQILNNRALPVEAVERAVYPFIGEGKTIDDVESARAALEKAYRDAGFGTMSVDIPEQKVADGLVTLKVIEGEISRTRVVGAKYFSQQRILDAVPSLAEGQVPNFPLVQQELAGVNRSADRRVTPVLRPGKLPGSTEVDLNVEDQLPLHGSLSLDNRYSPNTPHARLGAALRYDNLWQRDHSLSLNLQTAPRDTSAVRVASAGYAMPLGENYLALSVLRSTSDTPVTVGTTVLGRGTTYGARLTLPLAAVGKVMHSLTLGLDYKDLTENVDIGGGLGYLTPVRYAPLSANYAGSLADRDGQWQFGAGTTLAVRGMLSRTSQFDDKRYKAQDNFLVARFDVSRLQTLTPTLGLYARVDGQVASQPLISNEQYVAGGVDSVRGYLDSTATGDNGVRASAEMRWLNPFELVHADGWLSQFELHAFSDAAWLSLRDPLPQQKSRFELLSVGVGLRARIDRQVALGLDLAWPLRDVGATLSGRPHLHVSTSLDF